MLNVGELGRVGIMLLLPVPSKSWGVFGPAKSLMSSDLNCVSSGFLHG